MAQLRESVAAAVAALKGISDVAFQLPTGEIGEVVAELGELVAFGNAGLVRMTAEAEQRGVVEASQSASTAALGAGLRVASADRWVGGGGEVRGDPSPA